MSSRSPRACSPAAFCLGLLLGLATAFAAPAPQRREAAEDAAPGTSPKKTEDIIWYTLGKISVLKEELCDRYKCENSTKALEKGIPGLPKTADIDRCYLAEFHQEICLTRITSGLLEFQIYLEHLQKVFEGDKKNAREVHNNTKALIELLMKKIENRDAVTTPSPSRSAVMLDKLGRLQSEGGSWPLSTVFQEMLQRLEHFLQYSLRAVRTV